MLPPLTYIVSRLRIRQLKLLIAIDELGTLHRAAEHVAISQPGASKALHEVETTFGMPLFTRNAQGLHANDLGRCVIRYARLIHSDLTHLHYEMQGILQGHGGHVAVGSIAGSVPMVSKALTKLRQMQPGISVQIVEDISPNLLKLLDEGRIDLAIARTSSSLHPNTYECLSLHPERLALVAGLEHPQHENPELSLRELNAYSWVVYPSGTPTRAVLEREFGEAGLEFPRYLLETSSTFAMLSLLQEDSQLVALMPHSIACSREGFGLVRRLPLELLSRTEPCSIIHRQGTGLSSLATLLFEHLRDEQQALAEV